MMQKKIRQIAKQKTAQTPMLKGFQRFILLEGIIKLSSKANRLETAALPTELYPYVRGRGR